MRAVPCGGALTGMRACLRAWRTRSLEVASEGKSWITQCAKSRSFHPFAVEPRKISLSVFISRWICIVSASKFFSNIDVLIHYTSPVFNNKSIQPIHQLITETNPSTDS